MSSNHKDRWIATVDERRARLFRCTPIDNRPWHLEETETLRSPYELEHERGRPSMLTGAPGPQPALAGHGHTLEEEQQRFARDVAGWLESKASQLESTPVKVFAPPRFLGMLRGRFSKRTEPKVELIQCELSSVPQHELAKHPAVTRALAIPPVKN